MKPKDRELLLRASRNELSSDDAQRLQDLLRDDPAAAAELERVKRLEHLVSAAPRGSFAPGFANRVLQRIHIERTTERASLADSLAWLFCRAAPAALVLAVALTVFNLVSSEDSRSPLEAAVGLPAVTLEAAYAFDGAYYARDVDEPTVGR